MQDVVLITDGEMKRLKTLDYTEMMDWQFDIMQDLIDRSNEIIHKEYKDANILQQGILMTRLMVLLNMVNRAFVNRFPDSEMSSVIQEQYTQTENVPISDQITEEIENLKEHFDELQEILTEDFDNEKRRVDGINTVNRIATLNLREYEDALNRVFSEHSTI